MSSAMPEGIVGIVMDDRGRVVATAMDFDRSGYGGYQLWEAQRVRVKTKLALTLVRTYCSDALLRVIETHDAERMLGALIQKHNYVRTFIAIGYEGVDPNQ